ncbi:excalibur calcium-binding domain-containing protein [Pseudoclavibacter sp. CFCC 13611]|uniref:excalibur calcium-binding domain-containing protein n=1 Tax=Pseudoclavibacter sp. CFCC 13611 TaxID=2615178 RepID=UPI001300CFFF|nr:excalibur calcium-binding domain-containing protein [Pseudoclavibacter sp. CFCC 13611]KAB1664187.1 hypothetical protein F8O08_01865 [Pseudoclavibacter sp. CFCC 13611]
MAKPGATKSRSTRVAGMVLALLLSGTLLSGCLESSDDADQAEVKASQKAEQEQQKADEKARKDAEASQAAEAERVRQEQEAHDQRVENERKQAEEQQRKDAEAAEAERVRQAREAESARVAEEQRQAEERAKAEQAAQPRGFAGTGSSSGGGDVSYANCTAVKQAGKAPLYEGQPGYSYQLDRDRDGIACEK